MKVEEWVGQNNVLGATIWKDKYQHGDETFEQWLDRVSGGDKEVRKLIAKKRFLFGGRILANRGTGNRGTTSNCFTYAVEDSIESIYDCAKKMAQTYRAGGGVGVDISSLAPMGAKVNNSARTTSGAVSFIDVFTTTAGVIGVNGRRSALMVSISCDHPDVDEFIKLKTDINKATTANLSIRVSDDFMKAVENDEDWFCAFTRKETGECISKVFKAKELFQLFCDANYDYGEPGLLFWDTIQKYNMLVNYPDFKYCGVNPCFSGDTEILTSEGYKQIQSLCNKSTEIWNGYEWSEVVPQITGYNQPMMRITLSNGSHVDCTDYHKFILADGSRVECRDLNVGDRLSKCNMPVIEGTHTIDDAVAYANGFFSGDGYFRTDSATPYIALYGVKESLVDKIPHKHTYVGKRNTRITLDRNDGLSSGGYSKDFVPNTEYSISTRLSWFSGIVDSDGTRNSTDGSISVSSVKLPFLKEIGKMLNTLGISPTISTMKSARSTLLPDGYGGSKEYPCKESYRLSISASDVVALKALGFKANRVNLTNIAPNRNAKRFVKVTSIERIENAPVVYCMNEPLNHSVIANGIMTAQCGELPLPDGGACLLGSMNLAEYVRDNQFDIETFKVDVATAITALDTVQKEGIDLLPLDANKKVAKDWRPLGLGIMGLGDMLIKMNIPYGSPQSLTLCESIADAMATAAIKQSMKIGEESGSFPKFNAKQTASSPFYILHMGETPIKAMSNAQLLAIAPNGSIATMLGITGGIEPLYALEYDRTTKSLHGGEVSYKVIPAVVQEARDKGYVDGLVCSADIDYKARIDMQGIWQHHFDNSISSTVNLPHDFPREDVGELYKYAWKTGLKGITIFRDGCKRAGILTTDKSAPEEHEIVGVRRTVRTGCGNLHIIGMFDRESGALSEIFLAKGSNGGCLSFMTGLSRMISLSARNGASLESIIDQLSSCPTCPSYAVRRATEKDTAPGNCCPSAIGKALVEMSSEVKGFNLKKKRIDNNKKVTNPCPQCGAELVYTNGCRSCPECAWSKCD